jgi:hypothetical protein
MALARFFDKTALAAFHVLRGFDQQLFAQAIGTKKVAIFFDASAEQSSEGRWTLELTINSLHAYIPSFR